MLPRSDWQLSRRAARTRRHRAINGILLYKGSSESACSQYSRRIVRWPSALCIDCSTYWSVWQSIDRHDEPLPRQLFASWRGTKLVSPRPWDAKIAASHSRVKYFLFAEARPVQNSKSKPSPLRPQRDWMDASFRASPRPTEFRARPRAKFSFPSRLPGLFPAPVHNFRRRDLDLVQPWMGITCKLNPRGCGREMTTKDFSFRERSFPDIRLRAWCTKSYLLFARIYISFRVLYDSWDSALVAERHCKFNDVSLRSAFGLWDCHVRHGAYII